MAKLTAEQRKTAVALFESYQADFRLYAEKELTVRDHNTSQLVPFVFRYPQDILHEVVEKQKKEYNTVRIINLKSRRYGGSTYVEGRFYWKSSMNFNRNTFIVAHEEESTSTLFAMAKLFHSENRIAPPTVASNAQKLIFDTKKGDGLKSEYRLATARNVHAGKSQGVHYLHISEEAQFEGNPDELLTSLFACVPELPADTEIYRESTAQGYGNSFQEDTFEAYGEGKFPYYQRDGVTYAWKSPVSEWVLVFIPWFCVEIYTRPFNSDTDKKEFTKQIEKKVYDEKDLRWVESEAIGLQRKYNLTLEQLNWRQHTIENKCRGSVKKFHQNYPSNVEEAFLSKGSNVFGQELCDELEYQCFKPLVTGDVIRLAGKARIKRNRHGNFSVWEKPNTDSTYFITVDSAGGKKHRNAAEKKKTDTEPDRTNIDVWNHRTGNQAAQWNGHITYDLIGDVVQMIGEMFFMAPACVEALNHGWTVIADLKRADYPQYEARDGDPGWLPTSRSKPEMIDTGYKMARDADLKINCKETISEMRTFVEDPPTQFNAASGCNDDRVTTMCMASQMMLRLPKKSLDRGKKPFKGFSNWNQRAKQPTDGEYREVYVS